MPRTRSSTVLASPAAAAETAVAVLPPLDIGGNQYIDLEGNVDIVAGTAATAVTLRIRRGNGTAGTVVATYGPFTVAAGNEYPLSINCFDVFPGDQASQQYTLTVQVTAATGQSTVNNTSLWGVW